MGTAARRYANNERSLGMGIRIDYLAIKIERFGGSRQAMD